MSQSSTLGDTREITLEHGTIRYRERGSGAPIVFLHGLLVNGDLWRNVAPPLSRSHRCIVPDLPLGAHEIACAPGADLSVPGVARLVADFLDALALDDVTLVANDTGGALAQIVVTRSPRRIGRLALVSCDAYDLFPPKIFRPLVLLAAVPALLHAVVQPLRIRALQRLPVAFGWAAKRPIDPAIQDGYLRPFFTDAGVRRDCLTFLQDMSPRHTLEAAAHLGKFDRPVLVAWAEEDRLFPVAYARRLASAFPHARLELVPDSYTFVPEDQPQRLVRLLEAFVEETAERRPGDARSGPTPELRSVRARA
jgi:pimeloyl-ACP methyl ester carboxylesterase